MLHETGWGIKRIMTCWLQETGRQAFAFATAPYAKNVEILFLVLVFFFCVLGGGMAERARHKARTTLYMRARHGEHRS